MKTYHELPQARSPRPDGSAQSPLPHLRHADTPLQSALRRSIDIYKLLRTIPSLADLAMQPLMALADRLEIQVFNRGQAILRPGEQADSLYLIARGVVRSSYAGAAGGERTTAIFGVGDLLGDLVTRDAAPLIAIATAMCPTLVLRLDRTGYCRLLGDQPAIAEALLAELAARRALETGRSPKHVY